MRTFIPSEGPAQYKFVDPDTQYAYYANTKQALILRILSYREQNELEPIQNLSLVIDNYLCSLPENSGKCMDAVLRRSFVEYIKGGLTLLTDLWIKDRVSQEIADARAEVCYSCPNNTFPDKDGFVRWSDEIAERSVGDRKAKHFEDLGNCSVCSCVLKALCWSGSVDLKESEVKDYPEHCWKVTERKK